MAETNRIEYKQVLDKIDLENKTITKITSKERGNQRLWNPIALREAVINAFVHNDYTNELPPKFEFFADRIEITSAGGLPDGLSEDEFFEGFSVPRNKEIMRIYKDLNLVEQLGSGVPRILENYSKKCFKFSDHFLRMTFSSASPVADLLANVAGENDKKTGGVMDDLSDRQKAILTLLIQDNKRSYQAIAIKMKINESAVADHIKQLKEKKYITRIGGTRGYWKIRKK
jgi:ATP-dependent DNA helicase RecG